MAKVKMKITRCTLEGGRLKVGSNAESFEVQVNPAEITHARSLIYEKEGPMGGLGYNPAFARRGEESLSFSVVFDGTGAIPPATPGAEVPKVADQLKALLRIVDEYPGGEGEPSYVKIKWGSLAFRGRLESLCTKYTLFTPGGVPLRAKVALAFVAFVGRQEVVLQAASRDEHTLQERVVKDGDTLPQLCQAVYGDASYYPEVARANNLSSFRGIAPGTKLQFPPLV